MIFDRKPGEIVMLQTLEQEVNCLRKRVNDMNADLFRTVEAVRQLQVYGSVDEASKVDKLAEALGYTFVDSKRVPSKYVKEEDKYES